MNNRLVINFVPGNTVIHKLTGSTKVTLFILLTAAIIATFDIRILVPLTVFPIWAIISMRPNYKPLAFMFAFMFFTVGIVGQIMLFFVSPDAGFNNIGTNTVIWRASEKMYLSKEFLWYCFVTTFKRIASFAVVIAFLLSTTPSELAAGLNRIGVPYRVCIIVSLAYRTIPDVARHFFEIRNSLQMRGIEMSKKAGLWTRIKQTTLLLVPLIFTSFGKVENIANAMDLRSFGKNKRRTWFAEHEPTRADKILRIAAAVLGALIIFYIVWSKIIDPYPAVIWCPFVNREDIVNVNIVDTMFFMKWFK